jgi:4-hydroxybenzoate polyprenyltransferase
MRVYQWLKNLLVFVPLLASHRVGELTLLARGGAAFAAFSLCASGVYVLNDLFDLPDDRRHPRKQFRPFASGDLSPRAGLTFSPVLLGLSALVSLMLPPAFRWLLAAYFGLTIAYSIRLKQVVLLDVIVLAGLFAARVMAGGAAVGIWPSSWLLAFSIFLFLSLALIKRYAELVVVRTLSGESAKARGYLASDRELLACLGCASGYVSVLVLALYINSGAAQVLYGRHELIWLVCPLLLYWVSYLWLAAHRGRMHDDPLVFALRDRTSRIIIGLMMVMVLAAI